MKILGIEITKAQQNFDTASRASGRAFDLGLNDLGQWMTVYRQIDSLLNGGAGVCKITTAENQLAQSLLSWTYACISRIASEIKQSEWKIYKKVKGEWNTVDERDYKANEVMLLLERPFAYGNEATLKESIIRQLDASGYSTCIIERMNGKAIGLIPVNPASMTAKRTRDGRITGWTDADGKSYITDDVLFIHYPDPRNVWYPLSPVMAASYGIDLNNNTFDSNSKLLKRGGVPPVWFIPKTDRPLDQTQMDLVKKWMKDARGKDNKYEMPPMGGDVKLTGFSPRDMENVSALNVAAVEVCNAFGYPRPLITGEQINRSVMEVLVYGKNLSCIIPRMMTIETAITMQLIRPLLGPDYWLAFDRPNMVFSDEARNMLEEIRLGIRTINERRAQLGLDPVEWGDQPVKQATSPIDTTALMQQIQDSKRIEEATIKVIESPKIPLIADKTIDRVREWKAFDGLVRTVERPFKSSIMRSFQRQSKRVQDTIKERVKTGQAIDGSVFHSFDAEADFAKVVKEHIENAMQAGRDRAAVLTKRDVPEDPRIPQLANTYSKEQAAAITETTGNRIADYCAKHTIGNPAKDIVEVIGVDLTTFLSDIDALIVNAERADVIAESMTVTSVNDGLRSAFKDVGVEKKQWLSQMDSHVRGLQPGDEYNHNIDDIIGLREKFQTGTPGGLDYPGDPFGDAGDIINCRCTILPVLE